MMAAAVAHLHVGGLGQDHRPRRAPSGEWPVASRGAMAWRALDGTARSEPRSSATLAPRARWTRSMPITRSWRAWRCGRSSGTASPRRRAAPRPAIRRRSAGLAARWPPPVPRPGRIRSRCAPAAAMRSARYTRKAYSANTAATPRKPHSSPSAERIRSVCAAGTTCGSPSPMPMPAAPPVAKAHSECAS